MTTPAKKHPALDPIYQEALDLWEGLRDSLVNAEAVIIKIIETRAWEPLGYDNFFDAWNARLAGVRLATTALRAHVVYAMIDSGASDQKIIEATGTGDKSLAYLREQKAAGVKPGSARLSATRRATANRASSTVQFGLDPAEYAEMRAVCEAQGTTVQDVARRALRAQVWAMKDAA